MNVRNYARTGRALLLALILAGCLLCASASAGPSDPTPGITATTLTTGTFQIASVGQTIDVPITLDKAPLGFGTMQFTIKIDNASVADITDIVFPSWTVIGTYVDTGIPDPDNPGHNIMAWQELQTGSKTQLAANRWLVISRDGASQVNETSVDTVIATAKVQGKAIGSSFINVSVSAADTDRSDLNQGYWYPFPSTPAGMLYVGTAIPTATQTPVVTATETPVVTATETPVVTATETPVVTATATPNVTVTETPVVTVTETPNVTVTETPVVTVTATPNVTVTETPVVTATATPNVTATQTPVVTVTETPVVTQTVSPNVTQAPYPGPHVPTARIEAEDFDAGGEGVAYHDLEPQNLGNSNHRPGEGVDIETENGVTNVAYIRAGEYLKYSIDTTAGGDFTLALHAANPDTTAKAVKVYLDGVPAGQVLIGGTGGWTTYRDFTASAPLTIPTGRHVVTLAFEGINRVNLDWLSLSAGPTPTPTPTVTAAVTPQTTMYGPGNNIPGRVQAENFDKSGTGAANAACSDTTIINEGGAYRPSESVDIEYTAGIASYDVGWIRTGEWLIYTVQVMSPGTYTAQFNAANPDTANKAIDVYVDGAKVGTAQIGPTGSFGTFKKFALPIALTAGKHQIKLAFPSQRLNLDYVEFQAGGTVTPTPTSTTSVTGGSFVAAPTTAAYGTGVKFTVTPASGKTISAAWWSFDATNHMETWNSRVVNPTFFYPAKGTYSPLVKLTYSDGSTQTIRMDNYIHAT